MGSEGFVWDVWIGCTHWTREVDFDECGVFVVFLLLLVLLSPLFVFVLFFRFVFDTKEWGHCRGWDWGIWGWGVIYARMSEMGMRWVWVWVVNSYGVVYTCMRAPR